MNNYLSIIIPVYNGEKYLKECLDSIYAYETKMFEFELIIINDGSTDNSERIIGEYIDKYDNILYINNDNHGVSYSRNVGIEKASGKYVMFVDCDDLLMNNWQDVIFNSSNDNECDYIYYSSNFNRNTFDYNKETVLSYVLTYNDENIRISGPYSKLFLRKFINDNNIRYNEKLINGEDMLFNIEACISANKFCLIKDSFYLVRHNPTSSTSKFDVRIIDSENDFYEIISGLAKRENYFNNKTVLDNCMRNSIRTILYRLSYLDKYKVARSYFNKIRNDEKYNKYLNDYRFDVHKKKNSILMFLFKYRFYFILYAVLKKYRKNKTTYFETL